VNAQTSLEDGPLTGLRVVEFGQLIAGPYVGTLLADFGVDVIKVEAPPKGDALREWGRHRHDDHSLWSSVMARGKRSVALNLRTDDCRRLALELCSTDDVVVENFRPGTMEKWGLGPDDVHAVNPGCVYARISGYGQTGRYRDRPGFASAGEAIRRLRYINGYPGQAPPRAGISLGDTLAAQSAFQGILLALYARDARGASGQVVDAAITDACFAMLESSIPEYEKCGAVREPSGSNIPRVAPSNVYRSKDGRWVVIAANHDTLWRRLAELMGRGELADDARFATHTARGENQDELDAMVAEWASGHTAEELDRIVNEAGVVCAPVYSVADVYDDPYFREPDLIVEIDDEVHGPTAVPGVVAKLTATPGRIRRPARWEVGADTSDVLGDLDEEIEGLDLPRREGVA
jgi:succinyl-CoA---D-citramalate CoA-transferase